MEPDRPVVVAYRPEWPARAALLIATLRATLGTAAERIEHIGSTAIAGMAAKDVLDLQVSVSELASAAVAFEEPLRLLGFERTAHEQDHVPAACEDDPARWRKRLFVRRGTEDGAVNLHLREVGSPNERLALLFRDWFRTHPEAIAPYAAFKEALAREMPDPARYADTKDPVVDLVIVVAEKWAKEADWSSAPGSEPRRH